MIFSVCSKDYRPLNSSVNLSTGSLTIIRRIDRDFLFLILGRAGLRTTKILANGLQNQIDDNEYLGTDFMMQ